MTEKCVEARVILIPRFALPVHGRRSTVEGLNTLLTRLRPRMLTPQMRAQYVHFIRQHSREHDTRKVHRQCLLALRGGYSRCGGAGARLLPLRCGGAGARLLPLQRT